MTVPPNTGGNTIRVDPTTAGLPNIDHLDLDATAGWHLTTHGSEGAQGASDAVTESGCFPLPPDGSRVSGSVNVHRTNA